MRVQTDRMIHDNETQHTRTLNTNLFHTFYEACIMGRSYFFPFFFIYVNGENPVMVLR